MHHDTFPALTGTPDRLRQLVEPKGIEVLELRAGKIATQRVFCVAIANLRSASVSLRKLVGLSPCRCDRSSLHGPGARCMLAIGKLKFYSTLWNMPMAVSQTSNAAGGFTSIDKAPAVCEALSAHIDGVSLAELARALELPAPTVHRLLAVLKRRGYVRQDDATSRYRLKLKVLDLGFRQLGRSELKLHAYPVLREYALRTGRPLFHRGTPCQRGDACVEHWAGRGGDAHRLRQGDAGALRSVI